MDMLFRHVHDKFFFILINCTYLAKTIYSNDGNLAIYNYDGSSIYYILYEAIKLS